MPQEFDNELRGSFWINEHKRNPKQPDYTGRCQIGGIEYEIAMWEREGGGRSPVFTCSFEERAAAQARRAQYGENKRSEREAQPRSTPAQRARTSEPKKTAPSQEEAFHDDDIPF
jgi:hypothetical protein